MQIIVLNSTGSDIQKNSDSIAIRIAYLFAEKIGVSGSIKHDLAFLYRISKAPLKDKIDFVANYSNGQIPDFGNFFYDFKKVNQTFINTRNKSKQHIATFKKSEHIFMEGFNVIFRA